MYLTHTHTLLLFEGSFFDEISAKYIFPILPICTFGSVKIQIVAITAQHQAC